MGMNPTVMLKAAGSILILSAALFVAAKAFQEFGDVTWPDVALGLGTLVALAGVATMLGKGSVAMIQGAAAVAILGAAMIPLAFGLSLLTNDISPGVIIAMAAALAILGATAAVIGAFAPITLAGAGAILVLSLAFIPLGYGLG